MTKAKTCILSASVCICATFCGIAHGSCIVSGDISRDAAVSAPIGLASPEWFDSSAFLEYVTPVLRDFSSYPVGFMLIFR